MVNEEEEKRNKSIFDQVNAFFSFLFFFFSKVDLFFLSSMRRLMQKMTLRHLSNWRHFLLGNHKKRFARPNNDCDHWEKKKEEEEEKQQHIDDHFIDAFESYSRWNNDENDHHLTRRITRHWIKRLSWYSI